MDSCKSISTSGDETKLDTHPGNQGCHLSENKFSPFFKSCESNAVNYTIK
jgi:hypothetical protein